jgi:hypothetical protein
LLARRATILCWEATSARSGAGLHLNGSATQPVGLVVSPPALLAAQAHVDRNVAPLQQRFLTHVREAPAPGSLESVPVVADLPALFRDFLGWEPADLVGGPDAEPLPPTLKHALPDFNDVLEPTYAVREFSREEDRERAWILLVQEWPAGTSLDDPKAAAGKGWEASPSARFERLLRETRVGRLLVNGTHLRWCPPARRTSGHLDFPVQAMAESPAGRSSPPSTCSARADVRGESEASAAADPRPQPAVPGRCLDAAAGQVLAALYDLLRGFQAADDQAKGELRDVVARPV